MSVRIDASELIQLAGDLVDSADRVFDAVVDETRATGQDMRRAARALFRSQVSETYLPHYAAAITYETTVSGNTVETEVGPEFGLRQGGMGPGVEFGSRNTRPIPHMFPTLDAREPGYIRRLSEIAAGEIW